MNKTVCLSIIMPVFNRSLEVKEMLDSILRNSFQNWELILVDDGSESQTLNLLSSYSSADTRIRFVQREQSPKGAQTCRNIGLMMAQGDYVIFFDSDDLITDSCLATRVKSMMDNPEYDFLIFPSAVIENGKTITGSHRQAFGYLMPDDILSLFVKREIPFVVCNNIYKRSFLNTQHLVWDTQLKSLQDSDFNIQALLHGGKYKFILTQPDYLYRINYSSNSIAAQITDSSHYSSHIHLINKTYNSVQNKFHHKYDRALYWGALYIIRRTSQNKLLSQFAESVCKIVKDKSPFYGFVLNLQIYLFRMLEKVCTHKTAYKIVFFPFNIHSILFIKKKLRIIKNAQSLIDKS